MDKEINAVIEFWKVVEFELVPLKNTEAQHSQDVGRSLLDPGEPSAVDQHYVAFQVRGLLREAVRDLET